MFAVLTATFTKIGVENVNSDFATLIRTLAISLALAGIVVGIGRWRALIQPIFELMERVRKAPLFKNGAGHGGHSAGRFRCAGQSTMK